jgi:hypothetical protein
LIKEFEIMKSSISAIMQLLPKFETRKQVQERRTKLVRALEGGDNAAKNLARKLAKCDDDEPCNSPICPICVRALRQSFVVGVNKRIGKLRRTHKVPITAFSAILTTEKYRLGKLHRADLTLINKRLQRQYQRARLPLVFAGVDISLNEDSQRQSAPFWQIHVYGIVVGLKAKAIKQALKHLYPADKFTPKPFMAKECTYLPQAISYAIKATFVRRVSYIDVDNHGRPNTRKVSLKRSQLQELAMWLDQYPLSSRYLLTGCRRYGDRIELNPGVEKKLRAKKKSR